MQCGVADIYGAQSVFVEWEDVCPSIGPLSLYPIYCFMLSGQCKMLFIYDFALFKATVTALQLQQMMISSKRLIKPGVALQLTVHSTRFIPFLH